MNLARSDTYINVYIPREDGEDPRRFAPPNSPVFSMESVYKFSDMIVKDRPLFLGRKSLSMYEILTKKREPEQTTLTSLSKETVVEEDRMSLNKSPFSNMEEGNIAQTSLRTVSLNLDSKGVKKIKRPTQRFNEPLNAYVTNKKKAQMIHKYEPDSLVSTKVPRIQLGKRRFQETTRSESSLKHTLFNKTAKSKSAMEFRSEKTLGLPTLLNNGARSKTAFPPLHPSVTQNSAIVRAMPVRPSSKPQKIWKQSTEFLAEKHTLTINRLAVRPLGTQPGRLGYQMTASFPVK